jgi:hypothetical protein
VALSSEQRHIEIPIAFDCRRLKSPSARVIMQRIKNGRLAIQGLTAVLLFSTAFASSAAQVIQRRIPPPPAGVAQLSPAAACATDNTPRIGNINGTQSGIALQPGTQLNIVGCGFGRNGQVYLSGGGTTVQLKIDSWSDSNIHAQIDPVLGGVLDFGGVTVNVKPNGLPGMASIGTNSFKAARSQYVLAIPTGATANYSGIYQPPTITNVGSYSPIGGMQTATDRSSATAAVAGPGAAAPTASIGVFTRVARAHLYPGGFCPAVSDQASQMTDSWPVDFLADGFDVVDVSYKNETDAKTWDTQAIEWVAVGNDGSARYDATQKRIFATFQGSSMYVKQSGTLETIVNAAFDPIKLYESLENSGSACNSSYTLSLTVSGPRGISPFK